MTAFVRTKDLYALLSMKIAQRAVRAGWITPLQQRPAFTIFSVEDVGIFNTDQGCQSTSAEFTQPLLARGVKLSMDGKGRALDNVFVERLWRTVKYEEVYLKSYVSLVDAHAQLDRFFRFYNERRPHSSFDDATPAEVYKTRLPVAANQ